MPDAVCKLLAVVALATLGPEGEGVDDPAEIVKIGNRYAAAGSPLLLERLADAGFRLTPLDKALEFAGELYIKGGAHAAGADEENELRRD